MDFKLRDGPLTITQEGGWIALSGAAEHCALLAENVASFASEAHSAEGTHMHIEYFPGHYYLGAESLPLVVALCSC
jgi:hypothetical protein